MVVFVCHSLQEVTTAQKDTGRTEEENKVLYEIALRGLRLLSRWTSLVTELVRTSDFNPFSVISKELCCKYFKI